MTHPNEFDTAARRAHADAATHVSARVQAQLQQRRRAALAGQAASTRSLWPQLALGGTAVAALAVALTFALRIGHDPIEAPTPSVATTNDPQTTQTIVDVPMNAASDDASPDRVTLEPTTDRGPTNVMPNRDTTAVASTDATMRDIDALLADEFDDTTLLAANDDALSAEFEENPDLYLWLGSDENLTDDSTELL